jgi:peptidoglycan-N-acetylglucosamine deacetylase
MTAFSHASSTNWKWPNGARSAVSLTYDDGRLSHLSLAIPDLERFHFRCTFYLTYSHEVERYLERWKAAFRNGHEIGNHSYSHPSKVDLSKYDPSDIVADVGYGALWLKRKIGPDRDRTFAFPHGELGIGRGNDDVCSYANAIRTYHKVARSAGGPPNDPFKVNESLVIANASRFDTTDGLRFDDLRSYCEEAKSKGHWAVIMFHDVVARDVVTGNQTSHRVHQKLLAYLQQNGHWVAPVRAVAKHILAGHADGNLS